MRPKIDILSIATTDCGEQGAYRSEAVEENLLVEAETEKLPMC